MPRRWFNRLPLVLPVLLLAAGALLVGCAEEDVPSTANPFAPRTNILIVHSYDPSFRWAAEQGQGIEDGLNAAGIHYRLDTFFMDTRLKYTTPDQVNERAAEARALIDELHPAVVFVTDDPALRTVAVPYVEAHPDTDVAFVFSGINTDPTAFKAQIASLDRPGGRITGLLERIPVGPAMEVAKRVFPDTQRAYVLADGSGSSAAAQADYNATYPSGLRGPITVAGFSVVKTFAEWQTLVQKASTEGALIALVNYHGLTNESGAIVPPAEVLAWTLDHSESPVMGLVRDWVADGMPFAVGNSGVRNGEAAAAIAERILNGEDPAAIAITDVKRYETAFNQKAIDHLGMEIPAAEIKTADLVIR